MVCEAEQGIRVEQGTEGTEGTKGTEGADSWVEVNIRAGDYLPPTVPFPSSPPSGSGREGHCFYPETLGGESRCEVRASLPPRPTGTSLRILTSYTVGHLPGIVQKAELPTAQRFPGPLVSQLVPGGDKDRKL
jgi:hypothetical protein